MPAACERSDGAALVSATPAELPLNGRLVLCFDAPVDPLTVDGVSVTVSGGQGEPVAAEAGVEAGQLVIRPIVTPALLSRPPTALTVHLQGLPSPRALRTTDGRVLQRSRTVTVPLRPRLEDDGVSAPRLLDPAAGAVDVPPGGRVLLVFEGVLDPASVTPEDCALQPVEGGLVMHGTSVRPGVDWRCVGRRFDLELRPPPASGTLQLSLRRSGLRGLDGRLPEPAREIELQTR